MANTTPRYRLYRAAVHGRSDRFDCATDAEIPVVADVAIAVRCQADVDTILELARLNDLVGVIRVDANGRKNVVIQDRTLRTTRTVDACSLCGAQVEQDDDGPCCDGAAVVQVELLRPLVAMGVARLPSAGGDADLERLGLQRAS